MGRVNQAFPNGSIQRIRGPRRRFAEQSASAGAISRFLPGAAPVPVSAKESLRVDVVLEAVPFMGDVQHGVSKSAERELGAGERLDTVIMELVSSAVWDGTADLYRQMLSIR